MQCVERSGYPLRRRGGADVLDQSGLWLSRLQPQVRPLRAHHPPPDGRGARRRVCDTLQRLRAVRPILTRLPPAGFLGVTTAGWVKVESGRPHEFEQALEGSRLDEGRMGALALQNARGSDSIERLPLSPHSWIPTMFSLVVTRCCKEQWGRASLAINRRTVFHDAAATLRCAFRSKNSMFLGRKPPSALTSHC